MRKTTTIGLMLGPALPARILAAFALAAAVMVGGQFSSADLAAQERQAGDRLRLALWTSPFQKWKAQCIRSGGKYVRYCAGGVKHCCCFSAGYCEGMPEPVNELQMQLPPQPPPQRPSTVK